VCTRGSDRALLCGPSTVRHMVAVIELFLPLRSRPRDSAAA
jgi:hypothetical protein